MTDLKNNLDEVLEINPMNNKKYIEAVSFRDWQTCDLICDEHSVLVGRIKHLQKDLDLALNALQRESKENEKLKQELAQSKKEADTLNTDWCKCASLNGQLNIQNRKLEQELQKTREDIEFWKNEYVSHSETMCKCQEELQKTREQLEKCENSLMKVACFETHGENKYINHEQAYTGVANFARQYFQDKDKQG